MTPEIQAFYIGNVLENPAKFRKIEFRQFTLGIGTSKGQSVYGNNDWNYFEHVL